MATATSENDPKETLTRNVLGPAIFVVGALVAVMITIAWIDGDPRPGSTGLKGLARGVIGAMGHLPAFLAGCFGAWAGARLFLQAEPDDTLPRLGTLVCLAFALSLVIAPVWQGSGGYFGERITGRLGWWGFPLGLSVMFAAVWFFWLRDRFVLPDESEMPDSLSATLMEEGGDGISAEEADALLPMDDDRYQPARQNPELAKLLAASLATAEARKKGPVEEAESPYPEDVRKSGGIPAGTVPIQTPPPGSRGSGKKGARSGQRGGKPAFAAGLDIDETAAEEVVEATSEPEPTTADSGDGVHRWQPKERRLAGKGIGEAEFPEEESTRKLTAEASVTAETPPGTTPLAPLVRPIEDLVDIPPRPIWEEEAEGEDTIGALADALFDGGPIGPVRTPEAEAEEASVSELEEEAELEELEEEPELEEEAEAAEFEWEEADELEEEEADEDDELAAELEDDEEEEEEEDEEEDEEEEGEYAEDEEYEEEDEEDEEEEYEDDELAAELEDDEEEEEEEDEEEEGEYAEDDEYEEEEEEEEEDDEEAEAAELEDDEEYEDEEYEEGEEDEEAAELEEDEEYEEEELEPAAEAEVVLTPKAPPVAAKAPATSTPAATDGLAHEGARVSTEVVYDAGVLFLERGRVAVSLLQREFGLDFDESCEVMDRLQKLGLIGPYVGGHRRDILLNREEWLEKAAIG